MTKTYDLCIIGGCGHVGLPLGLAFAHHGKRTVLYDINVENVAKVARKEMPFLEEGAAEALVRSVDSGLLEATTEPSVIGKAAAVVLVTGTPVDAHLNPKLKEVMTAVAQAAEHLDPDSLFILRSTLYPGVTRKVHDYLLSRNGKASVAFCPERVAEGHGFHEITRLPQIVSAYDPATLERAQTFFSTLGVPTVPLAPEEAELAKLFTNAWRYINFATANQFFMIAESSGLDFYRVYQGMIQDYPRLKGFARAGFAAGPCLFKDTMQLSVFSSNQFFLGHAAMLINEGLPAFLVERLKRDRELSRKTVGILGMAFKADSDDARDSLAYKLKKILELEAARVLCSDVYIREEGFVGPEELVRASDLIILAAPHREYRSLDLKGKPFVDIWNFWGKGASF